LIAASPIKETVELAADTAEKALATSNNEPWVIAAALTYLSAERIEQATAIAEAIALADLWLLRFSLGKAYLAAGYQAEAIGEFMICKGRHGEATSLLLDDFPTYRYMVPLTYWPGVAQYGLGMRSAAAENFQNFLALRPNGGALTDDASQRIP